MLTMPGGLLDRDKEPKWYKKAPVMADWGQCQMVLQIFFDLSSTRQYGAMGVIYSIPWNQVMYYAEKLGLDHESAVWLWCLIRDIDAVYVREQNGKQQQSKRPPPDAPREPLGGRRRSKPEPEPEQ